MRASNYCAVHFKIFALSHRLASAHEFALPADMDLCRIYGHLYDALRHQICAVRRCVYQDRHHVADEPDDHDRNCELDGHDGHHHAAHELDDRDQNCVPDDLNYHDVDGHDRNCEPDGHDGRHHAAHELDDRDQNCVLDDPNYRDADGHDQNYVQDDLVDH